MTDQQPEATPEQQAQVRRLLAEARHTEPLPPDVTQRLDDVLAGLVDQRRAQGPGAIDPPPPTVPAAVHDLDARRRRRTVTGLLVAAAAVVVVGVGITQVVDGPSSGDADDATSAGGTAERAEPDSGAAEEPPPPMAAPSDQPSQAPAPRPVAALTTASFADDAAMLLLRDLGGLPTAAGQVAGAGDLTTDPDFVCDPTPVGAGTLVAVRFDGRPALLTFRPPQGSTQVVEVLQCGTGDAVRSRVLPTD